VSDNNKCKNCQTKLIGKFCSECGQKKYELSKVRDLFSEFSDEFFNLDSRVFLTFKYLITKPGFLTKEYWEGKKSRYLLPFRTILVTIFLSFAIDSLSDKVVNKSDDLNVDKDKIEFNSYFEINKMSDIDWSDRALYKIDYVINKWLIPLEDDGNAVSMLMFLPFTVVSLYLLKIKTRILYLSHHIISALYLWSGYLIIKGFILSIKLGLPLYSDLLSKLYSLEFDFLFIVYATVSFHNIYKQSFFRSIIEGILCYYIYLFLILLTFLILVLTF